MMLDKLITCDCTIILCVNLHSASASASAHILAGLDESITPGLCGGEGFTEEGS